jgi:hypothetical protein
MIEYAPSGEIYCHSFMPGLVADTIEDIGGGPSAGSMTTYVVPLKTITFSRTV